MKNRKTAWSNRKVYEYVDAMGTKNTLYPGMVDPNTGRVITVEDIRMLHAMDDAEVYNNRKNSKPAVPSWEKPIIEAWKADHPYEEIPSRFNLSFDNLLDSDEGEGDEEKCGTLERVSMRAYEAEMVEKNKIERMREIVMEMGESYWRLYDLHVIQGHTFEELAREMGMGCTTVKDRFSKIKKEVECKFY